MFILVSSTIILFTLSHGVSGNDYWWHVKTGEYIVKNFEVPTKDIFSWVGISENINWIAHEWLSDVIFYCVFNFFGNTGIYILVMFLALAFCSLILIEMKKYLNKNPIILCFFIAAMSVVVTGFFYPRPHIFSFYLLFFQLKIIYTFIYNNDTKAIYFIPLISVLWSNFHGGSSVLSYFLSFMVLFLSLFRFEKFKFFSQRAERKNLIRLFIVSILSVAGIMINPIGINALIYPYMNQSDALMTSIISEWQSPDAKLIGEVVLYFVPIFMIFFSFVICKSKIRLTDAVLFLFFVFLFFRSVRFIILWYICAVFCGIKYLPEIKIKKIEGIFEKSVIALCCCSIIAANCFNIGTIVETNKNLSLIKTLMNEELINKICETSPERLFNDYDLGGELIFNDVKVFFDSRADLFAQKNIMSDGIELLCLTPAVSGTNYVDAEKIIEKYNFDYFVLLKSRPLYSLLISDNEKYRVIYEDENIGYFIRTSVKK